MPCGDADVHDPHELVGVLLPASAEHRREMAYVFAEEFARLGHDRERILRLFRNPFYAGAHAAYRALGHQAVAAIIDEVIAVWGSIRLVDRDTAASCA